MSTTLDLIKARQATKAAQSEETKTRQVLQSEERIAIFEPIAKMWAEVAHLPFKAYRWHERGTVPATERLANSSGKVTTSISFYGGDGNTGWQLMAEHDKEGRPCISHQAHKSAAWRTVTLDEAKQLLIDFLADAIAPEALNPSKHETS